MMIFLPIDHDPGSSVVGRVIAAAVVFVAAQLFVGCTDHPTDAAVERALPGDMERSGIHPVLILAAETDSTSTLEIWLRSVDVPIVIAAASGTLTYDKAALQIRQLRFEKGVVGAWREEEPGRIRLAVAAPDGFADKPLLVAVFDRSAAVDDHMFAIAFRELIEQVTHTDAASALVPRDPSVLLREPPSWRRMDRVTPTTGPSATADSFPATLVAPGDSAGLEDEEDEWMRGDVNGDGVINSIDALAILSNIVGANLPTGFVIHPYGDADGDGQITATDALVVLSYSVGQNMSQYPVGSVTDFRRVYLVGAVDGATPIPPRVNTLAEAIRIVVPGGEIRVNTSYVFKANDVVVNKPVTIRGVTGVLQIPRPKAVFENERHGTLILRIRTPGSVVLQDLEFRRVDGTSESGVIVDVRHADSIVLRDVSFVSPPDSINGTLHVQSPTRSLRIDGGSFYGARSALTSYGTDSIAISNSVFEGQSGRAMSVLSSVSFRLERSTLRRIGDHPDCPDVSGITCGDSGIYVSSDPGILHRVQINDNDLECEYFCIHIRNAEDVALLRNTIQGLNHCVHRVHSVFVIAQLASVEHNDFSAVPDCGPAHGVVAFGLGTPNGTFSFNRVRNVFIPLIVGSWGGSLGSAVVGRYNEFDGMYIPVSSSGDPPSFGAYVNSLSLQESNITNYLYPYNPLAQQRFMALDLRNNWWGHPSGPGSWAGLASSIYPYRTSPAYPGSTSPSDLPPGYFRRGAQFEIVKCSGALTVSGFIFAGSTISVPECNEFRAMDSARMVRYDNQPIGSEITVCATGLGNYDTPAYAPAHPNRWGWEEVGRNDNPVGVRCHDILGPHTVVTFRRTGHSTSP